MTSVRDLDPCSYLPSDCEALLAVGWLGRGSEFPEGPAPDHFVQRLKELCVDPWQPFVSGGVHSCELCQFDAPKFAANVFIPFKGRIFVAPVGIVHYIAAHWYLPPSIFQEAVMHCPSMRSMEYKKAILSNGGRPLVTGAA